MLYMKEDDMDEMMRKAAANYEVDAEKAADWNAVYNAVHAQDGLTPVVEEKKKKRRFAFWWLLLIPVGWVANTEYTKFRNAHTTEKVTSLPAAQPKTNNNNACSFLPFVDNPLLPAFQKLAIRFPGNPV